MKCDTNYTRLKLIYACLVGFLCISASACDVFVPTATPTLRPTATSTAKPTATIAWFPATSTPTMPPTRQLSPTVNSRPGVGDVILEDLFVDTTAWRTYRTSQGTAAYGNGEFTLAISQSLALLTSLRSGPVLEDFYVEVIANPSLCRGADAYGLLLRASSDVSSYRVLVSCEGRIRLERLRNSEILVLQDWTLSGQVPAGAPAKIRLGVWVSGSDLRIFVNDVFQISGRDPVHTFGRIGVFARSAADPPLTVSFSQLVIRQLKAPPATAIPTKTNTPTLTPRATSKP
jgi:hypothetical protein